MKELREEGLAVDQKNLDSLKIKLRTESRGVAEVDVRAEFLASKLESTVARLRRLADEIERVADRLKDGDSRDQIRSYGDLAGELQNSIMWTLANCSIGGWSTDAAYADMARESGD